MCTRENKNDVIYSQPPIVMATHHLCGGLRIGMASHWQFNQAD